jgi:hypothetical protein
MASKTKDFMRKVQNTKSDAIIFATVVTAVLLFGGTTVSGLFPESVAVMDAPKAFAQQQIKQLMPPRQAALMLLMQRLQLLLLTTKCSTPDK